MKIRQLNDGMKRVELEVKLVELEDTREVKSRFIDKTYKVSKGIIADESGSVAITFWEQDIDRVHVGDTLTITNGYITSFKGEIQVNIGKYGVLTVS